MGKRFVLKNGFRNRNHLERTVVLSVNRKRWWHVPPRDAKAYEKRGKFFASTFVEAQFWGHPVDQPEKVRIARPLFGDERRIERVLFGKRVSFIDMAIEQRWRLDARMKRGYDSILLMSANGFLHFRFTGALPRSLELNVLEPS